MPHDADAPHLAGMVAETPGDFDSELVEQLATNLGLFDAFRRTDSHYRWKAIRRVSKKVDLKRFEPGRERALVEVVAGEALRETLGRHEAHRLAQSVREQHGRSVVVGALGGEPVPVMEVEIE